MRFSYHGTKIQWFHTPAALKMQHNNLVETLQEKQPTPAVSNSLAAPPSTPAVSSTVQTNQVPAAKSKIDPRIRLMVVSGNERKIYIFLKYQPMRIVMDNFCSITVSYSCQNLLRKIIQSFSTAFVASSSTLLPERRHRNL